MSTDDPSWVQLRVRHFRLLPRGPGAKLDGARSALATQGRLDKPIVANQIWLTGLTERRTDESTLNLCAIKDIWSNRIVGCFIDDRKAHLAVATL
jgi:hypothetical protein